MLQGKELFTVFFIGIGLAMDAFSVSVTNGMCIKGINFKKSLLIAFMYALFQFFMPVAGFFAASIFKGYIETVDHWVAFVLLFFIGLKMIVEAVEEMKKDGNCEIKELGFKVLTVQAVATSIDALAVGVGFAALSTPVFSSSVLIGIITFVLCFFGVYIGKKVGGILKGKAEIVGGTVLILIGIKILVEHLFF